MGRDLGIVYGPGSQRDVYEAGSADEVALQLCAALGWVEELAAYKGQMAPRSAELLQAYMAKAENNTAGGEPPHPP